MGEAVPVSDWSGPIGRVVMWEVRSAAGRLAELERFVRGVVPAEARVYRSPHGDDDERLVVVDPQAGPVPPLPPELVARPPHSWRFERIQ